uniref:Uncharacterized protein n=1 Tax=Anguilla anguilla TaxID=7936 RepID=A0A0E9PBA5_ANGAN
MPRSSIAWQRGGFSRLVSRRCFSMLVYSSTRIVRKIFRLMLREMVYSTYCFGRCTKFSLFILYASIFTL